MALCSEQNVVHGNCKSITYLSFLCNVIMRNSFVLISHVFSIYSSVLYWKWFLWRFIAYMSIYTCTYTHICWNSYYHVKDRWYQFSFSFSKSSSYWTVFLDAKLFGQCITETYILCFLLKFMQNSMKIIRVEIVINYKCSIYIVNGFDVVSTINIETLILPTDHRAKEKWKKKTFSIEI